MKMLRDDYNVEAIVVGYDNTFGCDGVALSVADYKEIGSRLGIEVTEAPFVAKHKLFGNQESHLIGTNRGSQRHAWKEILAPGRCRGREQARANHRFPHSQYPSACLSIVLPGNGVYAAFATLPDGSRRGRWSTSALAPPCAGATT